MGRYWSLGQKKALFFFVLKKIELRDSVFVLQNTKDYFEAG